MSNELKVRMDGVIYQRQSRGGISRLYSEILPRMCTLDPSLRVTLFYTRKMLKQSLPEHPHISHRSIPSIGRALRSTRLWGQVLLPVNRLMRRTRIGDGKGDIWHSTFFTMPPEGWEGRQVVTVYDMIHELFSGLPEYQHEDEFRERKYECVTAADAVIAISDTTKQDLLETYGVHSSKVSVVHLAYSEAFRVKKKYAGIVPNPFILYVGGGNPRKGFDTLLGAYSEWRHSDRVDLVLVGPGWTRGDRRRLGELSAVLCTRVLGDVDDEALCALYNEAEALVYPSLYEGFGITLLEAMACGCPIVASRIPSTLEVAGDVPIYFDPGQAEDLLCALDSALTEGRDSERVSKGLSRVRQYSWDKTARQTLEVYESLS